MNLEAESNIYVGMEVMCVVDIFRDVKLYDRIIIDGIAKRDGRWSLRTERGNWYQIKYFIKTGENEC